MTVNMLWTVFNLFGLLNLLSEEKNLRSLVQKRGFLKGCFKSSIKEPEVKKKNSDKHISGL